MEIFGYASDGTPLAWSVIAPANGGPYPAVAMFHGGGFHGGGPDEPNLIACANDLAASGFICFSVAYRLDHGHVPGQTQNAYWPKQTWDCMQAVSAMRCDSRCNGQVLAIGGSAGGTHATSVASQVAPSLGGPPWTPNDRVIAAVSFSGAYQFNDRTPDRNLRSFVNDINIYCDTSDIPTQLAMSPTSLLDATCRPIYCVRTQFDPMPIGQQAALVDKFQELGITNFVATELFGSSLHEFAYWGLVKSDVIAWLKTQLITDA